jgi:membrane protein DedA with SNARE-associated domain/rhodanese-related sulfurtransferase
VADDRENPGGAAASPSGDPAAEKPSPEGEHQPPGHERNGASRFTGARTVRVPHKQLRPGDTCPECGAGKVYRQKEPKTLVRIVGRPPLEATRYEMERLRCNGCGEVYTQLFIAVLAQQLGLPIPSVVFLMAAGALAAHGTMHPFLIVCLGVLGCLGGDGVWFWIGRRWGVKALRVLCRLSADPRGCSRKAQARFRRYGPPIFCVAKFVPGLDAVMPPLGGAEGVPVTKFLALDSAGSFLWSGCYMGLGYIFSRELDAAIRWVQHCGTALGIAVIAPVLLYAGWRGLVLARMIWELRQRRISPSLLARKLESDRKVAVLDLSSFEEDADPENSQVIPGALVVDPASLRQCPQIAVPDDVKVILYCPSGSQTLSARVAAGLKRIGVDKVWVLEGGLKAWRENGLPVSHYPELPQVVAERYGVKLPPDRSGEAKELIN